MWTGLSRNVLGVILLRAWCALGDDAGSGCQAEPTCLKCSSAGCVKCPGLIVSPSRRCVSSCPFGHRARWSNSADYMGQVCVRSGSYLGLSADGASVLVGALCGAVLCAAVVAAAALYLRHKRRRLVPSVETSSEADDSPERRDFVKQLEVLRPYAETYLEMLNDTRRQVRELRRDGDNTAAAAYKPVLRDLAKILLLLNRPADRLAVPEDWEHLYRWAEKALRRFKRMSETSQAQVNQLIQFFQASASIHEPDEYSRASTSMSTFKPDQSFGSSLSLPEQRTKRLNSSCEFNFNPPLNPQWQFNHPLLSNNHLNSEFFSSSYKNSKEYLNNPYFLEDDFVQLGFRPQDEITTEL